MDTKVVDVPEKGRFEIRLDDRVVGLASYHVDGTHDDPPAHRGRPQRRRPGHRDGARRRRPRRRPRARPDRPPLLLLRPALHPAASRATSISSPTTTGRTSAWRPPTADLRRPRTGLPTLRRCRRRCCGSAATCASSDHPALLAALDAAGPDGAVLPVFVLDPRLWEPAGAPAPAVPARLPRRPAGRRSDGALVLRSRRPRRRSCPRLVREVGAAQRARLGRRRPVRPPPRRRGRAGARRRPAGADRLPVRRDARPGHQERRHPVQGLLPVRPRLARARLAGAGAAARTRCPG